MTRVWQSGKTIVTRLRVRCSGIDPLSAQLRVTSLLDSARLHPTGLAPSAVVIIRKLRDPLPGVVQLQQGQVRPPLAWEQAVATALEQLVRRAARPALAAVPANAEAVMFADQAELLACLARDWCEGSSITRWWWQNLFKAADIAPTVLRAWLDAPEYVPAALQYMAAHGEAVQFVRMLSSHNVLSLLQQVTHSFALPELQSALAVVPRLKTEDLTRPLGLPSSVLTTRQGAPWQRWVPEGQNSGIPLEHQCLLGIGLMLQRALGVVRSPAFAPVVLAWLRTAMVSDGTVAPPATSSPTDKSDLLTANTERMAHADEAGGSPSKVEDPLATADTTLQAQALLSSNPAIPQQPSGIAATPALAQDHTHVERGETVIVPTQTTPSIEETPVAASLPDAVIDTGLGGLFYLINFGLFLGLYGDFTTPAQPGITLPIWDFVALLGHQLVGDRLQDDPVWSLLARLASRSEDEEPGSDFDPPESWRVSAAWLAPFSHEGIWEWETFDGRLRVRHPETFLVLDVPLDNGDPTEQLLRAMRTYNSSANFVWRCGSLAREVEADSPLQRWIGWLMPYVRARLHRALGLIEADDLPRVLCEHHARVFVTATHLEVVFGLDELPIEIRLAGLDRDPGWVPAAGRFIAFHFE
jgi:hypothetical protein